MHPKTIKQLANATGWRFVGQWQDQPILEFKKMADIKIRPRCSLGN
jgi:hypothetical protein